MKHAKTESGKGGGGIAGSMKQMFGGRAGKGKTGCASSDESPLGAGHLRRSKELGSAVVQKFSLLLYHFMEERGITLSTLFRLIDQADVPRHATAKVTAVAGAPVKAPPPSAFGRTNSAAGGSHANKASDGLLDVSELTSMVRHQMGIIPEEVSDDEIADVFQVRTFFFEYFPRHPVRAFTASGGLVPLPPAP